VPRRLTVETAQFLTAAARLAGPRPASTVDLLLAVLTAAPTPAGDLLSQAGVTAQNARAAAAELHRTESGSVQAHGIAATPDLALALLASADHIRRRDGATATLAGDVRPGELLAAALDRGADAAQLVAGLGVDPTSLAARLPAAFSPPRYRATRVRRRIPSLDRPFAVDRRSGPWPRFAAVAVGTLAVLGAPLALGSLTESLLLGLGLSLPALWGTSRLLRLLRPGPLPRHLTVIGGAGFLFFGAVTGAGATGAVLAGVLIGCAVPYLLGVAWCARSGAWRSRRPGLVLNPPPGVGPIVRPRTATRYRFAHRRRPHHWEPRP
jgi:hypothetical protein